VTIENKKKSQIVIEKTNGQFLRGSKLSVEQARPNQMNHDYVIS